MKSIKETAIWLSKAYIIILIMSTVYDRVAKYTGVNLNDPIPFSFTLATIWVATYQAIGYPP